MPAVSANEAMPYTCVMFENDENYVVANFSGKHDLTMSITIGNETTVVYPEQVDGMSKDLGEGYRLSGVVDPVGRLIIMITKNGVFDHCGGSTLLMVSDDFYTVAVYSEEEFQSSRKVDFATGSVQQFGVEPAQ
jgi:hypothetical protein